MPKLPTDYSKTIIYKIIKNDDFNNENIYVGSTTDFIRRKSRHKCNCNNENSKQHNLKVYKSIRSNGGWSEWSMIEIEKFPCNNKREALSRERYWYEFYNAKLNSMTMINTPEEKKEKHKQYRKEYYIENADKIKEQTKQYCIDNADKLKQYFKQYHIENADKIKQYRIDNADKMKQYDKQYYIENADKKKQYRIDNADKLKQKITCECGKVIANAKKSRHAKTQKHINFISSQQEIAVL